MTSKLNDKSLIHAHAMTCNTLNIVSHFYQTRNYKQPVDQSHSGLKWSTYTEYNVDYKEMKREKLVCLIFRASDMHVQLYLGTTTN